MKRKHKIEPGKVLLVLLLSLGGVVMIFPFIWMVLTSFKTFAESVALPIVWFPKEWNFNNYAQVLEKLDFITYYKNTIIYTGVVLFGQLFLCSLAGYSFARLKFRFKNLIFFLILAVLMVPPQMTLIPRYQMMNYLGWVDTYKGLIIPMIPSAYGTFFLRQFFMTLPRELEDSAKIDGCSYFRIYWNIMLPLCTSALVAYGIITAIATWNDLLWPLIVTNSNSMRVLSVAMACLQGQNGTKYQLLMAASVLSTIPTLVAFIIGQKHFIKGIALTGIKG